MRAPGGFSVPLSAGNSLWAHPSPCITAAPALEKSRSPLGAVAGFDGVPRAMVGDRPLPANRRTCIRFG